MRRCKFLAGLTLSVALCLAAIGQESDTESDSDDADKTADADAAMQAEATEEEFEGRAMDEITVIVGPRGQSVYEMEVEREAQIRETIYAEMRMREREEEEVAWRQADPDLQNPESRIKWGYSPQAEQRMRRENDFLHDLPIDQTKPATLFRVGF